MAEPAASETVAAIGWIATAGAPGRERLLELAAVRLEHAEVTASFSGWVRVEGASAAELAGLGEVSAALLAEARPVAAVLADLLAFLPPEALCVAHHADGLRALLRRSGAGPFDRPLLDTLRLAGLCFPEQPSHGLEFLCQALALPGRGARRAQPVAEASARLWLRLRAEVERLPPALCQAVYRLLQGLRQDPLRDLFRPLAGHGTTGSRALLELFAEQTLPRRRVAAETREFQPLDPEAVTALLDPEGPLAQELGHYEYREEQVQMAHAVVQAFNTSHHLLVEAGTGVGKSIAYLVPAILWAVINETPVVVSTNTRNLQAQLVDKDLPFLARALQAEFRYAMIKGRRNYLCLRKLLYLFSHADTELERADRLPLASVFVWAAGTATGDLTESIVGARPHLRDLASRITSVAEECRGPDCEQRRRCFLQRARRLAMAADVVVANHAVVFSEMANPMASPVLPPHRQMIFDEAHNLEDASTSAMSREVSYRRARSVLSRLLRLGPRRRARGLIPSLVWQLRKDRRVPGEPRAALLEVAAQALQAVQAAEAELPAFFQALSRVLRPGPEPQPCRIDPERKPAAQWEPVEAARLRLLALTGQATRTATALADALARLEDEVRAGFVDFDRELRAAALWLGEFSRDVESVLAALDPGWVCWVEGAPPAQGGAQAWGAPIDVGPLLHQYLYSARDSIVFTSATLTVNGSSGFVRRRLGLEALAPERLDELALGTVFDYARQCLVLVPTFLPEPDEPGRDYAAELSTFLIQLFRRTRGRGLALFTSHEMLRRCAAPLRHGLSGAGVRVFAQGLSGSRESLLQRFRSDPRTVLLGAQSFWEGVDVVGENLSCLVLARLPFAVHTEPVLAARCEAIQAGGGNPFVEYSLPSAVIRFRQGFGRLIRHRTDRGVVVVADRRIVSKRYGEWFRASLPAQVYTCAEPVQMLASVAEFLDA